MIKRQESWPSAVHKCDVPVIWPDKQDILPENIKIIDPSLSLERSVFQGVWGLTQAPVNTTIVYPDILTDHELNTLQAARLDGFEFEIEGIDIESCATQKLLLEQEFNAALSNTRPNASISDAYVYGLMREKIFTILDAIDSAFPGFTGDPWLKSSKRDVAYANKNIFPHHDISDGIAEGHSTWLRVVFNFLWPGTEVYDNQDVIKPSNGEYTASARIKPGSVPFMAPPGTIAFIGSTLPHQPSAHSFGTASDIKNPEKRTTFVETIAPFPLDFE